MNHEPIETANAIDRLDDLLQILRELNAVPGARPHVVGLRYDLQLLRDRLALTFTTMDHRRRKWLRKLEHRVTDVMRCFDLWGKGA